VWILVVSFFCAALLSLLIVRWGSALTHGVLDRDFSKPQKVHVHPVPRIGGLAVLLGVLAALIPLAYVQGRAALIFAGLLLLCALPAFVAGFIQDLTDNLTPKGRIVATAISAACAFFLWDAAVRRTDIPGLDWLVAWQVGSLLVTLLSVAGIAHAINIIDGFNGLASMCTVLMLAAIGYVAYEVGDPVITGLAIAGVGAVLGFFIWNFPSGLIFLGDGGAYFLGFYVAELCILLLVRNPDVSPLFALLVCVYPMVETLFSIYRRVFLRAAPASMPDGIHLHTLVYRRVLVWAVGDRSAHALTRRNALTSPYLWVLCMLSLAPAVLFYDNSMVLAGSLLLFGLTYVLLYRRIVRFQSPRWLRPRNSRPAPLQSRG
jgi:UDP-N-acetylmuramyl pentapeptide phosphotransferase/UDP-N-acetylglucosamine-1-phosphate transferase